MRVAQRRRRSLPVGRIESELDTAVDMLELLYAHDHHRAVPVLRQENGTALDDIPLDVRVAFLRSDIGLMFIGTSFMIKFYRNYIMITS